MFRLGDINNRESGRAGLESYLQAKTIRIKILIRGWIEAFLRRIFCGAVGTCGAGSL
jgi:hypothetical protein